MRICDWSSDVCSSDLQSDWRRAMSENLAGDFRGAPNRPDRGKPADGPAVADLTDRYRAVRRLTETLAAPLSAEDQQVQSMPDASPTTWHRAHVPWFFETFLLNPNLPGYAVFDPTRSEESRVGKECVSTCNVQCSRIPYKK